MVIGLFLKQKNIVYNWLVAIIIFLAPFNLFYKWSENSAYINGILSDYLIPKIWLVEIPILLTLFIWVIDYLRKFITASNSKKSKTISEILLNIKNNKLFVSLLLAFFLRQLFSINSLSSLLITLRLSELFLFGLFIKNNIKYISQKIIYIAITISILLQVSLANYQFFSQKNLFPYFVSGETNLTGSLNIAKLFFKKGIYVAPYGSTAHPNILAGYLVIMIIILTRLIQKNSIVKTTIEVTRNEIKNKKIIQKYLVGWLGISLISWTLFLTQSYSAIISFIVFITLKTFPKLVKKLSYLLFFITALTIPIMLFLLSQKTSFISIDRRVFLNQKAILSFTENILWGTGLNNFLYSLKTINTSEIVRFLQPAHNIFLLWLTETGLLGIALIAVLQKQIRKHVSLLTLFVLLPIVSLDHYFLTQWIGNYMLILMVYL
ncbi:MAG: hypothetical protein HOA85_00885 [Candidatus Pacebacteria bacterium]|nr:hypothetical protein [Candidatus Paceibacterota bacterium]